MPRPLTSTLPVRCKARNGSTTRRSNCCSRSKPRPDSRRPRRFGANFHAEEPRRGIMTNPVPISLDSSELKQRILRFQQAEADIVQQIRRVIVGQEEVLEQVLIALFVGGHCLITGLPGTAKTLLVRTIAQTLGLVF